MVQRAIYVTKNSCCCTAAVSCC